MIEEKLATLNIENSSELEKDSLEIQILIKNSKLSLDSETEIINSFTNLNSEFVAVRSSASSEDGAESSFAGQLESYLNTTKETLIENILNCFASLFSPRCLVYQKEKGFDVNKNKVAVVVQSMIQSEVSGVAFTVHPVTNDRSQIYIEAGFGLGEAIVGGYITPDGYLVSKKDFEVLELNLEIQEKGLFKNAEGENQWLEIYSEEKNKQKLNQNQIQELAIICLKIEEFYNFPCDIEWCFYQNNFFIVQSRPITTLGIDIQKYTIDLQNYFLFEDYPEAFPLMVDSYFQVDKVNIFLKSIGINHTISKTLQLYNQNKVSLYLNKIEFNNIQSALVSNLQTNLNLYNWVIKDIIKNSESLIELSNLILEKDNLTFDESIIFLKNYILKYGYIHRMGWIQNTFDTENAALTNFLHQILEEILKKEIRPAELFSILTTPRKLSTYQKSDNFLISIKNQFSNYNVKQFLKKYSYLGFGHIGPPWGEDYVQNRFNELKDFRIIDLSEIKKIQDDFWKTNSKYIKHKKYFDFTQNLIFSKGFRKEAFFKSWQALDKALSVLSNELEIDKSNLRFILPQEVEQIDLQIVSKDNFFDKNELKKRFEKSLIIHQQKNIEVLLDPEVVFQNSPSLALSDNQIYGQIAYSGYAKGIVAIVNTVNDLHKVNSNSILVSSVTGPELLPGMNVSKAILTDMGGITCHAAIISRELKIPCIIGTKIATQVLKDGDLVEVDADNGVIRILEKADN